MGRARYRRSMTAMLGWMDDIMDGDDDTHVILESPRFFNVSHPKFQIINKTTSPLTTLKHFLASPNLISPDRRIFQHGQDIRFPGAFPPPEHSLGHLYTRTRSFHSCSRADSGTPANQASRVLSRWNNQAAASDSRWKRKLSYALNRAHTRSL
jgi:hypothetical protein